MEKITRIVIYTDEPAERIHHVLAGFTDAVTRLDTGEDPEYGLSVLRVEHEHLPD